MLFHHLQEEFESWLTEVEVKMIALQPYTSDENLDEQVQQLKQVNKEIKDHEGVLKELLETRSHLQDERLMRQGIVEELNQRYQQVRIKTFFLVSYHLTTCASFLH